MSLKKWVQLSDVHFGSPDSHNIEAMRKSFLMKCDTLKDVHYLFITGDLRFAKNHPNDYHEETVDFIKDVQKHLNIDSSHTFMVPGNHDVGRATARNKTIESIIEEYLPNRTIAAEHKPYLNISRQQYLSLYEKICANNQMEHHFVIPLEDINIIHIDTSILCGRDGEDGTLLIDMLALDRALKTMDISKPAIALAHHTFDSLEDGEQEQLELLLKHHNTVLFLCGHKHWTRGKNIRVRNQEIDLWEFVCGTNMDSVYGEEVAEIGFFTGEINTKTKCGFVESHKWSPRNNDWLPNSDFSFPQSGAFDGKYYFPKRVENDAESPQNTILELAQNKYIDYLKYECGEIQLNGLPMDNEIGYKTFALEKLFVPLHFLIHKQTRKQQKHESDDFEDTNNWFNIPHNIIPNDGSFRRVVFAGPGGGKTTLMKRLASAYGIGKISSVDDCLPHRPLFPIWIKCRQFGTDTPLSLLEIIRKIPERADFALDTRLEKTFFQLVSKHIKEGTALILIDGLDEISDESNRLTFISKLKNFAAMNDKINIVITSRSVGYEQITKNLFFDFVRCRIQPFSQSDIERLCIGWHRIVLSDTKEVVDAAKNLSDTIIQNEKIFKLAQTPVLLTTLLLVNRRIGRLPTKRAALYHEAIKVLLDSWGTEARLPIDLTEALPQLAYLAHHMMFYSATRQIIGKTELIQVLLKAREELPEYFSSSSETVFQFIDRVEDRSALLVKRGYRYKEGSDQLEEEYEFPHLTFQEYLAAYAIANQYYPNATRDSHACDCFENCWENEDLREVILLTSVLTNKWEAQDITNTLITLMLETKNRRLVNRQSKITYLNNLLMQMVVDEVPLNYDIRNEIYKTCFSNKLVKTQCDIITSLYQSKYLDELQSAFEQFDESRKQKVLMPLLGLITHKEKSDFSVFDYYLENMHTSNYLNAIRLLDIATWLKNNWLGEIPDNIQLIKDDLLGLCLKGDTEFAIPAFSALYGLHDEDSDFFSSEMLKTLLRIIDVCPGTMVFADKFPITTDNILHLQGIVLSSNQKQLLHEELKRETNTYNLLGCFWFGVLFGAWDTKTVIQKAEEFHDADYVSGWASKILYNRMTSYLTILQDIGFLTLETESIVAKYLEERGSY